MIGAKIFDPTSKSTGVVIRVLTGGRVEVKITNPRAWHQKEDVVIWDVPEGYVGGD